MGSTSSGNELEIAGNLIVETHANVEYSSVEKSRRRMSLENDRCRMRLGLTRASQNHDDMILRTHAKLTSSPLRQGQRAGEIVKGSWQTDDAEKKSGSE